MAERHGKNAQIILDGTVIKMASMDISMTQDKVEVTGFLDATKRYVLGAKDFAVTFSGFWDSAVDKLFDIVDAGAAVNGYFYPDVTNHPTYYWWGSVLVQASLSASTTTAVGLSGEVSAAGAITRAGIT